MPVDTKHNNIIVASSWYKGQYKNNGRIECNNPNINPGVDISISYPGLMLGGAD